VGDGAVANSGVAHGKNNLGGHPVEIPHALGDGVIGEHTAERSGDGDPCRRLIGHRRSVWIQENFRNRRQLP
jgi:hypothetical protein